MAHRNMHLILNLLALVMALETSLEGSWLVVEVKASRPWHLRLKISNHRAYLLTSLRELA